MLSTKSNFMWNQFINPSISCNSFQFPEVIPKLLTMFVF